MSGPDQSAPPAQPGDLFQSLPVPLFRCTPEGQFLEVNQALVAVLGYPTRPSLEAANFAGLFEDPADFKRHNRILRQEGRLLGLETRLKHHHGGAIWVRERCQAFREANGQIYYEGSFEDITRCKQAEAALQVREEKYSCLFHQSSSAILIQNLEGGIIDVNQQALELTGLDRATLLGLKAIDLLSPANRDQAAQISSQLALEGPSEFGALLTARNGEDFPVKISASTFEVAERTLVQWSMRDARERNKLEKQLRQAQRMEAVGRLAGGIAHDFNNLLTVISMYCDLLLSRLDSDSPPRTDVEQIKKAGERAATLTRQLLAFSRQQVLRPQILDLNLVVSDLGRMLRRLIRENIELETALDSDLGRIKADPGQLEQVLMNLVVNASNAMPAGGRLRVRTENLNHRRGDNEHNPLLQPGHWIVLSVSDSGIGIAAAAMPRIFEPFYTTKDPGKGTGLGLSTVYGIVKQSGGFVFANSEQGVGTQFRVYLPRVEDEVEPHITSPSDTGLPGGSETILVVEDQTDLRTLVGKVLRDQGYRVLEAENGAEALAKIAEYDGQIHLMVTDLVMPGMSGSELSNQVRDTAAAMKVLFMSGYSTEAITQHGLLEEGTFFLEKPFTSQTLARQVNEMLQSSRAEDTAKP